MNINFRNLIRQLLPPHKRQPVRLALLRAFAAPLAELFASFAAWRADTRMMINVNSQVKVLEGYLRKKYNQPIAIKIETYADGLLIVGFEQEGELMTPVIGEENEDRTAEIPKDEHEVRERFGDVDFIVYVPQTIDLNAIRADIEKYKQVLTRYKIK